MKWKKLWLKASTSLVAEMLLSWLRLDYLANYSEFVFALEDTNASLCHQITLLERRLSTAFWEKEGDLDGERVFTENSTGR